MTSTDKLSLYDAREHATSEFQKTKRLRLWENHMNNVVAILPDIKTQRSSPHHASPRTAVALPRDYRHMGDDCQVQDLDRNKLRDYKETKVDTCLYKTKVHKT